MLYPRKCILCHNKIVCTAYPAWLCKNCLSDITVIKKIFCFRCGSYHPDKCICSNLEQSIKIIRSCFVYNGSAKIMMHKWKYGRIYFLKDYFTKIIKRKYPFSDISMDAVIAVPIHFLRKIFRGFNQAEIISKVVSKEKGIVDLSHIVQRIKYSKPQSLCKSKDERKVNVRNAFKLKKNLDLKKILIVDDIITSGSTVNEFATLFPEAEIYVFTLSMAF